MKHSRFAWRIIIAFVLLIMLPAMIVMMIQNLVVTHQTREQITENARLMSSQYTLMLDQKIDNISTMMQKIAKDENLRRLLSDSNSASMTGDSYLAFEAFKGDLNDYVAFSGLRLHSLCLTNTRSIIHQMNNVRFYDFSEGALAQSDWFIDTMKGEGALTWHAITYEGKQNETPVLSVSCAIRSKRTSQLVGTVNCAYPARQVFV